MVVRSRWKRWGRWVALATTALVVAVLLTGWLLFQHVPSWYRPLEIPPQRIQAVRDDLVRTGNDLNALMATADSPFEYRFTQDQINAWLASREEIWPLSREWLPPALFDPFLAIDENGVRLAVTFQEGSIRTILSARIALAADQDGIRLRLDGVSAGGLPSPEGWIRDQLAEADRRGWPAGQRLEYQSGPGLMPPLAGLFEGVTIPNGWIWPEPRRFYRITDIRLQQGAIVVRFEPRPRQGPSR